MADGPGSHAIENHVDPDRARTDFNAFSERLRTLLNERLPHFEVPPPSETDPRLTRAELPSSNSTTAATFLESLPIIKPEDLPESSQICHICQEDFDDPDAEGAEKAEVPVKLPCNHIMGSECLARWCDGHNSCPMCRATLFVQDVPQSRLEEALAAWEATGRLLRGTLEALERRLGNESAFA